MIPPPEVSPYIGHFNIEIPLGGDINANGENDKIKFTIASHSAGDMNRTFTQLPDGTVLDEFDSAAFLEGAIVDESTDPPFTLGSGSSFSPAFSGPGALTGPTTASSSLLNPTATPGGCAIAGGDLNCTGTGGPDRIVVSNGGGGVVNVQLNETNFHMIPTGNTIIIDAGDGDNEIVVAGNLSHFNTQITTAGAGDNYVDGGGGADTVTTGDGDDTILTGVGDDVVNSGGGNDKIDLGPGSDFADAGAGNDELAGMDGNDILLGGSGDDVGAGGTGGDRRLGLADDDILSGDVGNDVVVGGDDDDTLFGRTGNDIVIGSAGSDGMHGNAGDDLMISGTTDDDADTSALRAALDEWQLNHVTLPSQFSTFSPDGARDGVNGDTGNDFHVTDSGDMNFRITGGDTVQTVV